MDFLREHFFVLLPIIIIINIALLVVALRHCLKHQNYRCGNRLIWICVIVLIQTIGPILYFVFGSEE